MGNTVSLANFYAIKAEKNESSGKKLSNKGSNFEKKKLLYVMIPYTALYNQDFFKIFSSFFKTFLKKFFTL